MLADCTRDAADANRRELQSRIAEIQLAAVGPRERKEKIRPQRVFGGQGPPE